MAIDTSVLNIDFEVLGCSTNCMALKIVDLSNWGPAISNPTYIDITTPGSTVAVTNIFQKGMVNVFNGNNLNLSDVQDYSSLPVLPDGVYQICIRVCIGTGSIGPTVAVPTPIYKTVCKYWLQDCELRGWIAKKMLSLDLTCQPCRKELLCYLMDVQLFLDAAQAQIQNCNVNKAMEYFLKAKQLLERMNKPGDGRDHDRDRECRDCWPGWSLM